MWPVRSAVNAINYSVQQQDRIFKLAGILVSLSARMPLLRSLATQSQLSAPQPL